MKSKRQSKILELVEKNDIETQDELLELLLSEGYNITQATVSRDIRELKLTKIALSNGRQKYAVLHDSKDALGEKYEGVFRAGFISMDMAGNILVIKTVSGMAGAVCAAIDAMQLPGIVGSIAGDDTIMCAVRTVDDTALVMKSLRKIVAPGNE